MKRIMMIISAAIAAIAVACSEDEPIIPYKLLIPQDPFTLNIEIEGMNIDSAMASTATATCSEKNPIGLFVPGDGSISVELPIPNYNIEPDTTMNGDTITERRRYLVKIDIDKKRATIEVEMYQTCIKFHFGDPVWFPEGFYLNKKSIGFVPNWETRTCYVKLKLANGKIVPAEQ